MTEPEATTLVAGVREAAPAAGERLGAEIQFVLRGDSTLRGLLPTPLVDGPRATLLVCASHTAGATAQLKAIARSHGAPVEIDTMAALEDPVDAGSGAVGELRHRLVADGFAMLSSQRERKAEHNTLSHGERVMSAITTAVASVRDEVDVVITKGGITSSEVAATGLGVQRGTVLGQVLPGVSVWSIEPTPNHQQLLVVVPGNVGGPETLKQVLAAVAQP